MPPQRNFNGGMARLLSRAVVPQTTVAIKQTEPETPVSFLANIWRHYCINRSLDLEAKLPRHQVWVGNLVTGQSAETVAQDAAFLGWRPSPAHPNRWCGETGGVQIDGNTVTFIIREVSQNG